MNIFMLLDKEISELKVLRIQGQPENAPIGVIKTVSTPLDVYESFNTAALGAHEILQNKACGNCGWLSYKIDNQIAGQIYGYSAGLAFAIGTIGEMLQVDIPIRIAATGIISDEKSGTIEKVEHINEKLLVALDHDHFSSGGIIFYPEDNDKEIPEEIKEKAAKKEIGLQAVKTLSDIMDYFYSSGIISYHKDKDIEFPKQTEQEKRNDSQERINLSRRMIFATVFIVFIFTLYGYSSPSIALYLLENNHYTEARWHLRMAKWAAFYNSSMQDIIEDFGRRIAVEDEMTFIVRYHTGKGTTFRLDRIPQKLYLQDAFAFRIITSDSFYLYIFRIDETNTGKKLYPYKNEDYALITSSIYIPEKGAFFQMSSNHSKIYLILSRWRCRRLEEEFKISDTVLFSDKEISRYHIKERSVLSKKIIVYKSN
ncbi:MAG: hypothetical protein GY795_32085 [Desulfobacterales bacterium]|nr:hypothetical protein [Desulfobacterales bacterium]